jgi:hypothetical protein
VPPFARLVRDFRRLLNVISKQRVDDAGFTNAGLTNDDCAMRGQQFADIVDTFPGQRAAGHYVVTNVEVRIQFVPKC